MAPPGTKVVATNRVARHNYEILEAIEVGIMLVGSEVKSLRESKVQLGDAYGLIRHGELWLHGLSISAYSHSGSFDTHDPARTRKLLAHAAEIDHLRDRVDQERLSLVPLSLYFRDGRAKLELALGRGRKRHDKRQAIAARDAAVEARNAMGRAAKGRTD